MYQIMCDGYILQDARIDDFKVINPKASLQLNKTGTLTFEIHPTHPYYDKIQKHTSVITLYQDDKVLFSGRVLNDELDFDNIKNIECEGELSYLLDSIQRLKEYHLDGGSSNVIETYLKDLVTIHNSQVDDRKKFSVGVVTVTDPNNYLYRTSNYKDTLTEITDKLLNSYGGFIKTRHTDEGTIIDYLAELNTTSTQTIEFGKNIVDMTKYIKGEDIFTALIPLGNKTNTDSEVRLTISSLPNSTDGTIVKQDDYVYDSEAVLKYGFIWRTQTWDDVTKASNLLSNCKALLKSSINETLTLELTAVDLHLLNVDIDDISLGDKVQCVSIPHNLNVVMVVESMSIDIDNPANTKIKLVLPEQYSIKDVSISSNKQTTDKEINEVKESLKDNYLDYNDYDNLKDWTKDNYIGIGTDTTIKNIDDLKDWTGDNYIGTGSDPTIKDFDDVKDYMSNHYTPLKDSTGSTVDLSSYAKIADVNTAFDQLASALSEV